MLNSSRNIFVIILKLNFLKIQLGISIYEKHMCTKIKGVFLPKIRYFS